MATHVKEIITTGVQGYVLPPEQNTDSGDYTIIMTPQEGYEVDVDNLPSVSVKGEDPNGYPKNFTGTFTNNTTNVSYTIYSSKYNRLFNATITITGSAKKKEEVQHISEIVTTGVSGYTLPPEQTTDDTNFIITMTPQEGYEVDGENLPTITVEGEDTDGFIVNLSGTFTNNNNHVSWSCHVSQYNTWDSVVVTIEGTAKKKEDTPTPPTPPTPTKGTLYGIINVYKPSSDNMNELASKEIVDSVGGSQRLVNLNEYIVDYFKLFATVPTTKKDTIKMYIYDTEIESDVVEYETISIDCGSVTIEETHMNSLDYEKTTVEVFLPFIGLKTLDTVKVMGKTIKLLYKISVLTGDCVAMLIDSNNIMFETFDGNMSFKVPRMVSDKFHDKTLNDTSNYLLGLTPYVIIRTPIEYANSMLNKNHVRDKIGTFTEYNEFSNFRLDNISCTATEKEEIKRLLQEGITL